MTTTENIENILTEKFLRKQYCELYKTRLQISLETKYCIKTICKYLNKFNIRKPPIDHNKKYKKYNGKKYNRWTILKFDHMDKAVPKALCLCKCGTRVIRSLQSVVSGSTRSCGCLCSDLNKTGYGEISGQFWRRTKSSAAKRGKGFSISIKYAWGLFLKQNKRCSLTGVNLIFVSDGNNLRNQTASLDRIDSSKGYIKGNVQWVHKRINWIKSTLGEDELIYWCRKIINKKKNYKCKDNYFNKINYTETT